MIKITEDVYQTNFQSKMWQNLFEKYANVGVNKYEVIEMYKGLAEKINLETKLSGLALDMKVYKTLEDKFVDMLEAEE